MDNPYVQEMADDQLLHLVDTLITSSRDDDMPRKHGGSRVGRAPNLERGRQAAALRLFQDYLAEAPVYSDQQFRSRFGLSREVFKRIEDVLEVHDPFFAQRQDCTGRKGLTYYQKDTAARRMLAHVSAADSLDEYLRIGESTMLLCLDRFCDGVVCCFEEEYLRAPSDVDLRSSIRSEGVTRYDGEH